MQIRLLTFLVSFSLHGIFAALLLISPGSASLETGESNDDFVVQHGIAIESISPWGIDDQNMEAVEAIPLEESKARQEIKENKQVEEIKTSEVLSSENGPDQEKTPDKIPNPSPQNLQQQVATLEQSEQIAVQEKRATSEEKLGGTTTAHSIYRGKLRSHLEKHKINPKSRLAGKTVVRFTIDPAGQLLMTEIAESSGIKLLDEAALASVKKAAPYPAMPQEITGEPMIVSVPFRFTIR